MRLYDYWVDGHYILAETPEAAKREVRHLYNHEPESVRRWTAEDQEELERVTA